MTDNTPLRSGPLLARDRPLDLGIDRLQRNGDWDGDSRWFKRRDCASIGAGSGDIQIIAAADRRRHDQHDDKIATDPTCAVRSDVHPFSLSSARSQGYRAQECKRRAGDWWLATPQVRGDPGSW